MELIDLANSVTIFLAQTTLLTTSLDLFISLDASIYSTVAFPPLGIFDHVVVSFSIDFPSYPKGDSLFHCTSYDYSQADWDSLFDHLTDISWEDIFKLCASTAATEFCEWTQVEIGVYIPHCKYQVKPHSSSWFLAAWAAAIAQRNHFFVKITSKMKPKQTSSCY